MPLPGDECVLTEATALAPPAETPSPPPEEDIDEDYMCVLCRDVLYRPAALPCGHVFCKGCLAGVSEHSGGAAVFVPGDRHAHQGSPRCPVCRRVMPDAGAMAECKAMSTLVQKAYPDAWRRRADAEREEHVEQAHGRLPIFVLEPVLPRQTVVLNVFEPRYRLMVSRTLASGRRAVFGMVGFDRRQEKPLMRGTELEITECRPRRDGTYLLEAVGKRVFEVTSQEDTDGYITAAVRYLDYTAPAVPSSKVVVFGAGNPPAGEELQAADDEPPRAEAAAGADEVSAAEVAKVHPAVDVAALVARWEELVTSIAWNGHVRAEVQRHKALLGPYPEDKGSQSMWIGGLLYPLTFPNLAGQGNTDIRPMLLATDDPEARYATAVSALHAALGRLEHDKKRPSWITLLMITLAWAHRTFHMLWVRRRALPVLVYSITIVCGIHYFLLQCVHPWVFGTAEVAEEPAAAAALAEL